MLICYKSCKIRRTVYGQYQIKGTVISDSVATFVKNYILDSGFYDMLGESINKYTAGEFLESKQAASKNLANMITPFQNLLK